MTPQLAVRTDALFLFANRHVQCGRLDVDLPRLPDGVSYRILAACRCGDTFEEWVDGRHVPRGVWRDDLFSRAA